MRRLVEAVGMKIVIEPRAHYVTKEGNEGITACVCIETSHAAMHVWDKTNPTLLRFDLYSCACFDPKTVIDMVKEFEPGKINYVVVERDDEIKTTEEETLILK
jgi:S-adenosylmethionine/arginine decarboxylase-like enzyme